MSRQRFRIVIVGSGLPAWFAAATLTRVVPQGDYSIVALDAGIPDRPLPLGPAEVLGPSARRLLAEVQPDEQLAVTRGRGCFSFGVAIDGWAQHDHAYFSPFGTIGAALGPLPFYQIVLRLRRMGLKLRLADFSMAALAAQAGRFERPVHDPGNVLSTCRYGLHVDGSLLAESLAVQAVASGVEHIKDEVATVELDDQGRIRCLETLKGRRVEADLVLDCSGERRVVSSRLQGSRWIDWSRWLPSSRVVTARSLTLKVPEPYSHAQAHERGWIRHLPLHGETWLSAIHAAGAMSDDEAAEILRKHANGENLQDLRSANLRYGRDAEPWYRNCIAVGAAAAVVDPIGASGLHLMRSQLDHLARLVPRSREQRFEAAEYNRRVTAELDSARDFTIAHYRLNGRHGDGFWDERRAQDMTESLRAKLQLFHSGGRVVMTDDELFEETPWIMLFDEHGIRPRGYSPLADAREPTELQGHLQRIRSFMLGALRALPTHADYLFRLHGRSAPPESTAGTVTIERPRG